MLKEAVARKQNLFSIQAIAPIIIIVIIVVIIIIIIKMMKVLI